MYFKKVAIKGTGTALPKKIYTNKEIEQNAPTTEIWIQEKLGIFERRQAVNETVSSLGTEAAKNAILDAGIEKKDIDLIIVATSSPEKISPATACTIHKNLNLDNVPAFDVNAVCAGFVFALTIAAPFISNGIYKNVLIVASEVYSKITDWNNKNSVFFGDGAGAIILGPSTKSNMFANITSNGGGTGSTGFFCNLNESYSTRPKEVWQQAVKVLPNSINEVLAESKLSVEEIDMFVPHQASLNMLKLIAKKIGIKEKNISTVMDKYANIAGASIPIALDDAIKKSKIKNKDTLLLSAIGSGWSWGSVVINYEKYEV